ncbi:MAG: sulfite exporter TauE/SafE family protein [Nitratireductor sp.]|nr:sulfite exporter TauE/SafE family protein [Nitratireductor sp.]
MLDTILQLTALEPGDLVLLAVLATLAGLVRGFAGFGLSAIVMAGMASRLAPVELIPVCFTLEFVASIAMVRGGMRHADMRLVALLAGTSAVGLPIGLFATTSMDPAVSKLTALAIIVILAMAQLLKFQPRNLASTPGIIATGLTAGMAAGLASVGGMVIALYVLASSKPASQMRASLVMYLAFNLAMSLVYFLAYGLLNQTSAVRGLLVAPAMLVGLAAGAALFNPQMGRLYRTTCLLLLLSLAGFGLFRQLP